MAWSFSAFTRNLGPLALLVLALGLSACATPIQRSAFAPTVSPETTIAPNSNLREAVAIGITFGPGMTEILTVALAARDMLARSNETFRLDVGMVRQSPPPVAGLDFEVTMTLRYRLTRVADNAEMFDREITTSYTAKFSDAPVGVQRYTLALGGSARVNIERFLTALIAEERANPQAFSRTSRARRS
jgi:hypothetical protein